MYPNMGQIQNTKEVKPIKDGLQEDIGMLVAKLAVLEKMFSDLEAELHPLLRPVAEIAGNSPSAPTPPRAPIRDTVEAVARGMEGLQVRVTNLIHTLEI